METFTFRINYTITGHNLDPEPDYSEDNSYDVKASSEDDARTLFHKVFIADEKSLWGNYESPYNLTNPSNVVYEIRSVDKIKGV